MPLCQLTGIDVVPLDLLHTQRLQSIQPRQQLSMELGRLTVPGGLTAGQGPSLLVYGVFPDPVPLEGDLIERAAVGGLQLFIFLQ